MDSTFIYLLALMAAIEYRTVCWSAAPLLGTRISICKLSGDTFVYRAEWINSLYQHHTEGKSHPAPSQTRSKGTM